MEYSNITMYLLVGTLSFILGLVVAWMLDDTETVHVDPFNFLFISKLRSLNFNYHLVSTELKVGINTINLWEQNRTRPGIREQKRILDKLDGIIESI